MAPGRSIEILHVDDDYMVLEFVKEFIKPLYPEMNFTTIEYPRDALELLHLRSFDCVILDYKMPEMDGLTFAAKVREFSDIPIILYTGQGSEEVAERTFAVGVDDYIKKENSPAHYQVLAKRIASVVEKKRVEAINYALERSTRERLEALHRHATSLVNLTTLDELAECSLAIIDEIMGFTLGSFLVVHEGSLVSIRNRGSPTLGRPISLSGKGITAKAARERRSILVRDVRSDPDFVRGATDSMSELAVPIILGKEVVAVINIESLELDAFDEADQKLIEILSEHIESTIQRIRLLESVKRYTANLEALQRHATNLATIDTVEGVAECCFDIIEKLLGFTVGSFGVVEEGYLRFIYARTVPMKQLPKMPLNGEGITVRAVKTGESQLVSDIRFDKDFVHHIELSDLLSELDVPVKIDGRVAAVINLEKECLNAFSDGDRRIIEILGEQVASAISRIEQLRVIKASGETYRKLLDSSLDSVLLLSGTKLLYVNRNMAKLLGYDDVSELIGQDVAITLANNEKEKIRQRTLSRQRGEPQPDRYELELIRKDGTIIQVEAAVSLTEYEGKPAVLSFARDISDRKRYQTKLIQLHGSAKRLAGASTRDEIWDIAVETMSLILGFDFAGIGVLDGNTVKYIRCVGAEIPSDWSLDLSKPSITSRAIELGIPQLVWNTSLDPDYLTAPGMKIRSSALAIPIIIDGHPIAVLNIEGDRPSMFTEADLSLIQILVGQVSSAIDRITHLEEEGKRRETRQRERLEGIERMSSMVRHDLRGPLQTIESASYLIRNRPDRAEELTRKIDESVDYAVRILDDLKVMMKPRALNRVSTSLSDLVEKSVDCASIPATLRVVRNLVPLSLEVDQYRIRRVVDNLIKNAVEAMPDGGTLTLKIEAIDSMALLTVQDTGRGITDETARNLFTPFYTTKPAGTGLGLAICKQVVEAHGGRITFESRVGEGTAFTVALPLVACTPSDNESGSEVLPKKSAQLTNIKDSNKDEH